MPDSPFLSIRVETERRLVRVTRLATRMSSARDVAGLIAVASAALAGVARASHRLLLDLRQAPLPDESSYADDMRAFRRALIPGFARAACLVETQIGLLQVQRFLRTEQLVAGVFQDEKAAITYLDAP